MGLKTFQKPNELKQGDLSTSERLESEKKITPETKETLEPKEKEEFKKEILEEIAEKESGAKKRPVAKPAKTEEVQPAAKSPTLLQIESILEEDLENAYFKMEPEIQQKFKIKGEETAAKIEKVLTQTKVKAKKIFKLILDWLKIIPGINKFFIKQEAKIKTDKIVKLKQ